MDNVCSLPNSDVDVFARHRPIHYTRNDDGRYRESKSDLCDDWTCRAERRRCNERTRVVIDDNRYNHVKCDCNTLLEEKCFLEVLRILQLGVERQEGNMAGCSKSASNWSKITREYALYAKMMFRTGPRPLMRGMPGRIARTLPISGFEMPMLIIAMKTARMILAQANMVSSLHILSNDILTED